MQEVTRGRVATASGRGVAGSAPACALCSVLLVNWYPSANGCPGDGVPEAGRPLHLTSGYRMEGRLSL